MSRRMVRGTGVVTLTLYLVVAALSGNYSSLAAGASSGAPHRCYNIQLSIAPLRSNGGAGHVDVMYRAHNLWSRPCTLTGYPGAELLGSRFHSFPTNLRRGLGHLAGEPPIRAVTLATSRDAYFVLEWSQVPIGTRPCQMARYVLVTPPNDNLPDVTYGFPGGAFIRVCSPQVIVSPVASAAVNVR